MAGVRVVEVAMYGFVTSAGAVLADWGADVLKVEHAVTGDPQRGLRRTGSFAVEGDLNPNVEHPNRGKRSIGLDISSESGRAVLDDLVREADVFLTSLLPSARRRFRIEVDDVRAVNPAVVYARGSALGARGEEADRGGYDMTAFWARGATAASLTPPDVEGIITPPAPAYGDTISGTPGRRHRRRPVRPRAHRRDVGGRRVAAGQRVWAMGAAIDGSLLQGRPWVAPRTGTVGSANPLSALYRTADGHHLSLVMLMLQPTRYWADVCRHIDRRDLADDPRFATFEGIQAHAEEAVAALREAFAAHPLAWWTTRLAGMSGPWAPVQDTLQVGADPQVRSNGYIATLTAEDGSEYELVTSPVQFDERPPALRRAPAFAEHTDDVLAGLGYDGDRIIALKVDGAVT
jgi:crotonobetainyl-CoA:carnitine CoA-transferase CaiB-like acyl-CoA transferase